MQITADQLMKIATTLEADRAQILAELHNEICPKYKIEDVPEWREFLTQEIHESQEFSHKSENLNYSAEGLLATFPKYFTAQTATLCARNPEKIANMVYCYRMGNGSYASGDGWTFRGAGNIGGTGRDIFTRYGKFIGNTDPVAVANLARTDDRTAIDISCWIFAIDKGLLDEAEKEDIVAITKRINGGENGLAQRKMYEDRAKKYIV